MFTSNILYFSDEKIVNSWISISIRRTALIVMLSKNHVYDLSPKDFNFLENIEYKYIFYPNKLQNQLYFT
jgi:hypothetical protein